MQNNKEFLATEPIGKLLLKLAVPSVISQLVNMLYNVIDRIYIGHIPGDGSLALTGVGVCMPIILVISAFAALIGFGGAPRASIFMGKNEMEQAKKTLGNCFSFQIIISVILTALLLCGNRFWCNGQAVVSKHTQNAFHQGTFSVASGRTVHEKQTFKTGIAAKSVP